MSSIRTNVIPPIPSKNSHIHCEPILINTFRDKPRWIDLVTTLRIATQNAQGIKPFKNDAKLQSGIGNMVSLQAGITCLTETKVEWHNYCFRQAYKDALPNTISLLGMFLAPQVKLHNHLTTHVESPLSQLPTDGHI
jgi:hypothetical protein